MKYRKKPVVIEAFKLGRDCLPDWFMNNVTNRTITTRFEKDGIKIDSDNPFEDMSAYIVAYIDTLEGTMKANNGDYVIKGVQGEIYPCKPDVFEATYELIG